MPFFSKKLLLFLAAMFILELLYLSLILLRLKF